MEICIFDVGLQIHILFILYANIYVYICMHACARLSVYICIGIDKIILFYRSGFLFFCSLGLGPGRPARHPLTPFGILCIFLRAYSRISICICIHMNTSQIVKIGFPLYVAAGLGPGRPSRHPLTPSGIWTPAAPGAAG